MLWGTTYLVTTQLLPADRPMLVSALRALPAALLLLAGVALLAGRLALPQGAWWWRALVLGTLNIGLFFLRGQAGPDYGNLYTCRCGCKKEALNGFCTGID